ncbi:hypothetical protein [Streptomyces sp. NPDC020298]|uniref:hypothetical protein n=1 Tax=unclassified Streptomyces TaxID=2593676 RepID=UPI0034057215
MGLGGARRDGELGGDLGVGTEADADCLVTGDRTATSTAIVTKADPEVADQIGQRLGFSVYDGSKTGPGGHGRDRLGFSWGVVNTDTNEKGETIEGRVGTCMAPAPFAPVMDGEFTVNHADLPPFPRPRCIRSPVPYSPTVPSIASRSRSAWPL